MTTPLQQAAQALIDRWESTDWKDTPHTAHYVAELRKALDAELAQSVEPVAWTLTKTIDARETTTTAYLWFVNPINTSWTPLYLHPPQPQATTLVVPEGYALVPIEPTPAMCAEGLEDEGVTIKDGWRYAYALYTSMVKAAQGEKP